MVANPTFRVGDRVTWAFHDEDVGEDEVGVVKVIYEDEKEADVAFLKGDFCLELGDLTVVADEPLQQGNGHEPLGNETITAPRRPSRAYEDADLEKGGEESVVDEEDYDEAEEEYDSGEDNASAASSRRLNFEEHDGDDGIDYGHGVGNEDGAWDTDERPGAISSNEPLEDPEGGNGVKVAGSALVEDDGDKAYDSGDKYEDAGEEEEEEVIEEQDEIGSPSKEQPNSSNTAWSPRNTMRPRPSVPKAGPRAKEVGLPPAESTVTAAPEPADSNARPSDVLSGHSGSPNNVEDSPATISTMSSSSSGGRVHEEAETSPQEPKDDTQGQNAPDARDDQQEDSDYQSEGADDNDDDGDGEESNRGSSEYGESEYNDEDEDLADTLSSKGAIRGVNEGKMIKFNGPSNPRQESTSESLTAARKDYEYRAANGLLSTAAEGPSFQNLVRNKTALQLKMENAEFREARELELQKRMSRVEMDKWGKEMREETVKALVEARKAFEKRREQGRMSTRAEAPAITAIRRKDSMPQFQVSRTLTLSEKLDLEAAAFRARAKRNKAENGGKTGTKPDNTEALARLLQQPARHARHSVHAPMSTNANQGNIGQQLLQAEKNAAASRQSRAATAQALVAARAEYEKRQANANKHSNNSDGKVTTVPRAPRCASLPPTSSGMPLDGTNIGKKGDVHAIPALPQGLPKSRPRSQSVSTSQLNSQAKKAYLDRIKKSAAAKDGNSVGSTSSSSNSSSGNSSSGSSTSSTTISSGNSSTSSSGNSSSTSSTSTSTSSTGSSASTITNDQSSKVKNRQRKSRWGSRNRSRAVSNSLDRPPPPAAPSSATSEAATAATAPAKAQAVSVTPVVGPAGAPSKLSGQSEKKSAKGPQLASTNSKVKPAKPLNGPKGSKNGAYDAKVATKAKLTKAGTASSTDPTVAAVSKPNKKALDAASTIETAAADTSVKKIQTNVATTKETTADLSAKEAVANETGTKVVEVDAVVTDAATDSTIKETAIVETPKVKAVDSAEGATDTISKNAVAAPPNKESATEEAPIFEAATNASTQEAATASAAVSKSETFAATPETADESGADEAAAETQVCESKEEIDDTIDDENGSTNNGQDLSDPTTDSATGSAETPLSPREIKAANRVAARAAKAQRIAAAKEAKAEKVNAKKEARAERLNAKKEARDEKVSAKKEAKEERLNAKKEAKAERLAAAKEAKSERIALKAINRAARKSR